MKNVLLAIFLVLASCCYSQSYKPFLNDSAHWTISEFACVLGPCDPGSPFDPNNYNYNNDLHLKIDGDSIVDGVTYKKLLQYAYLDGRRGPYTPGYILCDLLGLLSEDTVARKVYIKIINQPASLLWCLTDSVLFDFSKSAGDTMRWAASCSDTLFVVDSVGYSIPTFQCSPASGPVKTWYLRGIQQFSRFANFRLYESIGSNAGFFGGSPAFEGAYQSLMSSYCVGADSACLFTCPTNIGIVESKIQQSVKLYPNPATSIFTLDITDRDPDQVVNFVIYNALGQEMHRQRIENSRSAININDLTAGIYQWQLITEGWAVKTGKLVRQD